MHGPRCAYCHQYFLNSELSVDHIVPRALSGKSIVRNMQLLCYPCHKMKDQPSTKLIQMNACIIKPRILFNYPLTNATASPPLHPIPLAQLLCIPFAPFALVENNL
jgi:5-methylcytosine-specific restriction endonuclease McrA